MFSRWYLLFIGFLLLVLGIAGLAAPSVIGAGTGTLVTVSVIWLITAVISLWYGFRSRNMDGLRRTAGIIGGLYFLWGIIQLIGSPSATGMVNERLLASISGLNLLLGSIGLSAALVPATWMREDMAGGHAV